MTFYAKLLFCCLAFIFLSSCTQGEDTSASDTNEQAEAVTTEEKEDSALLTKYSQILGEYYDPFSNETVSCLANLRLSQIEDQEELEKRLDALTVITNENDEYLFDAEDGLYEVTNDEVDCLSDDDLINYLLVYYAWPEDSVTCLLDKTGNHDNLREAVFFNSPDYKPELQECTPWVAEGLGL